MKQSNKRMNLMRAIVIWVFFAVLVLLAVFSLLWYFSPADKDTGLKPLVAIVTASLTMVGGIGAVAYLVMKYRERQDKEKELEQEEANQRRAVVAEADRKLNDAVAQLGSESPQVRLAGVYALADVADNYLAGYKQRVVDILCGYLRTDRTDLMVGGKFKDAAVESAIIKVIGEHLRKDRADLEEKVQTLVDEQLWCDCSFDFRGATFTEPVSWANTLWNKTADFSDSEFSKDLRFHSAKFAGEVLFAAASFGGETWFDGASFAGFAWFAGASFAGGSVFDGASFAGDAGFDEAGFAGDAWFNEASFIGDAVFAGAGFAGDAWFNEASFIGDAGFAGVSFAGYAGFAGVSFAGDAGFAGASFINMLHSEGISFEKTPGTEELLLANPEAGTVFDAAWNLESYNHEWTLEKKIERLKEVYKQFCEALHEHPQQATKLADIQQRIRRNFPDVDLDFKALETETRKLG